MPVTPVLQVSDGGVVLGGRPVLRGVELAVAPGEFVGLLGANGSGKSTLVRAVLGLVPLRRGEVFLFGSPLREFRQWRRVGYVPQRITATAGVPASVREVVASGRLAHRTLVRHAGRADRTAVRDAIEAVGLSDRAGEGVATLSGGQQQRVLIARALAGDPELLILDEPTAGVDLESQETFAAVMGRLAERGSTVLLVAHELGPLATLIQRTVVMRDGRVAYDGPPLRSFVDTEDAHGHGHLEGHEDHAAPHADYSPDVRTPVDRTIPKGPRP